MRSLSSKHGLAEALEILASLVTGDRGQNHRHVLLPPPGDGASIDGMAKLGPYTLALKWKSSGAAGPILQALDSLRQHARESKGRAIPLIVVPYMGDVGRERCDAAGVSWLDLSGNARIVAPGLRVVIEGKPNRFKRPGRPASVFAPQASRITRCLLINPGMSFTQRELAQATGVDEGYTSRIVARLESDDLVVREAQHIRPRDPDMMLDAWQEAYQFDKHDIVAGHMAARSGEEAQRRLADTLGEHNVPHAVTGLGAAWLLTHFAGFRLVTLFVAHRLPSTLLDELSFREESRGANVWLVVPNDEGVLLGATRQEGIQCVHPVQVYVDLKGHPERSSEAAAELRTKLLTWRADG